MSKFFHNNVKYLRKKYHISQKDLAKKVEIDRSTISRIENAEIETTVENVKRIADALNITLNDIYCKDLTKDIIPFNIADKFIEVPISNILRNCIASKEVSNIIDYVAIPRTWLKNDNSFFAIKIDDNSLYPHYKKNDIIIFEKTNNFTYADSDKKDCAIEINNNDIIIRNVNINENGITLTPLNINNINDEKAIFYSNEQLQKQSIKILGILKERRTN